MIMDTKTKIKGMWQDYFNLSNELRSIVSALLMDTSEQNPIECEITIEPEWAFGLSSLQMPTITAIYQDPSEGLMWIQWDGDESGYQLWDEIPLNEQLQIAEQLLELN